MKDIDILIVGAGILGLASAYHLKQKHPEKSILLIDRNSAAGQGNTAKSAALFRNVFSSPTNFMLADSSVEFYLHTQNELGYDLGLRKLGYMWLLSSKQHQKYVSVFKEMMEKDVELETFEKEDLNRMIPGINLEFDPDDEEAKILGLESIEKGVLGVKCGRLDVDALVKFYEDQIKKLGVNIQYNTSISELILEPKETLELPGEPYVWQDKRIAGVRTNGRKVSARMVILALGAWTPSILDPVGIDSHVKPKKRQLFSAKGSALEPLFNITGFNQEKTIPMTIVPNPGVFIVPVRSEMAFWIGCADDIGRAYKLEEDPQAEQDYYHQIYMVLKNYFPHFTNVRPTNMWAGLYADNSIDGNPNIFREGGAIIVTGASGSGILKADSIGRITAALYGEEEYAELFGARRFKVSDLSIKERNVKRERFII
ncbi:MAG: NAD(P)/FAD-dependent oxidoreductase [Candidatus Hodarchaeota archaeon]